MIAYRWRCRTCGADTGRMMVVSPKVASEDMEVWKAEHRGHAPLPGYWMGGQKVRTLDARVANREKALAL